MQMPKSTYTGTKAGITMTAIDNWVKIEWRDREIHSVEIECETSQERDWYVQMHRNETIQYLIKRRIR